MKRIKTEFDEIVWELTNWFDKSIWILGWVYLTILVIDLILSIILKSFQF